MEYSRQIPKRNGKRKIGYTYGDSENKNIPLDGGDAMLNQYRNEEDGYDFCNHKGCGERLMLMDGIWGCPIHDQIETCPKCDSKNISECKGGTCYISQPNINYICQDCLWEW
jgi:hypothetical protein